MQERRHISHQNPDHPADAEVGWKCDEFLSGCSFYVAGPAFTRRAVAQSRHRPSGLWLCNQTAQKITLLDAIVLKLCTSLVTLFAL